MFQFEKYVLSFLLCFLFVFSLSAQENLNDLDWDDLIYDQPDEWYTSKEAIAVAKNVLFYQRDVGGYPKNSEMHLSLTKDEKKKLRELKPNGIGATIDNDATIQELDFLSKTNAQNSCKKYTVAILKFKRIKRCACN